jgi:hypothetical protein
VREDEGLPLTVLYLINGTVRAEERVEDGESVISRLRAADRYSSAAVT